MTTFWIIVLVVVAVVFGVYMYLHGGPDGGRDPGMRSDGYARLGLRRRIEKNSTLERPEQKFQEQQAERWARGEI